MSVYKDEKTNTWKVYYRYTDWQGKVHQSTKRGFSTKREALAWEREQKIKVEADLDMTFESFVDIYTVDMKNRIKENTWHTKEHIMRTKILPYFGQRKISEIRPKDIIAWQNEMIKATDKQGKPYSPVYLKTLHNQLSAIFNHAVKFYGLRENPAAKVGNMGKAKGREMLFWTQEEYQKFSFAIMDKPISFYAFEMLYWCGVREGELLALTPADFDFERGTVTINKSYQRIGRCDVITDPKTAKSNRTIKMPQFLIDEMQEYLKQLYGVGKNDRIFEVTKSYLHHEMDRGSKQAGVKRIRIHDLRHSHISLLIDMGYSAVAIADRVGHESIDITYNYAHLFRPRRTIWRISLIISERKQFNMSAKNVDRHNRFRNITVGFRVSPEEQAELNRAVALSGLSKQEYCYRRCMERDVVVQGNPRVYKALKNQMADVLAELQRIEAGNNVSDDLLNIIELITVTMDGLKGDVANDE